MIDLFLLSCDTLIEVGRCQAAYEIYRQFGRTSYMEVAHGETEKARALLSELGVSKTFYDANVKLTSEYTGTPLSACLYNPLKHDYSILPTDNRLLTMIQLSMGDREYREWAKENYDSFAEELRNADILAEIQKQIEENSPPTKLPDGTIITPDNKENETTFKYFQEHIQNDKMAAPLTYYYSWLDDTYGRTEWRKKVEMADEVLRGFTMGLITETVNGVIGTVKFAFQFVVDPEKTTKEVVDTVSYLAAHPDVLVEAAKKMYTDFENASPEQKAEMIGGVASLLVPGTQITKVGKVGKVTTKVTSKVTEVVTSAAQKVRKIDYPASVSRLQESFARMLPYRMVQTPEGVMMMVPNPGKMEFGPSKPPTIHDGPSVAKVEGKLEGIAESSVTNIRNSVNNEILDNMESKGGHLLEKHVSKTNEDLLKRAAQEGVPSTTFSNKSTALKATQENIRKNAEQISDWLINPNSKGYLITKVKHEYPVGKGVDVKNGGNSASKIVTDNLTTSQLYLVKDPLMPAGYRIITGYPVFE